VSASGGDGTATVSWGAAAANRSPITSYQVSWRADSGQSGSVTVGGAARGVTVNGLTNGTRYTLTVVATNGVGSGPGVSAPSVVPYAAATAPSPTASYRNGTATVSWAAPDLRGAALVDYAVTATGQSDQTVGGTTANYSVAAGQTITFTVRAVTRTQDGRTLTGAAGTTSLTVPATTISISEGQATTSSSCAAPKCADVDATMTGFAPNTQYPLTLSSSSNPDVRTETCTTDSSGNGTYNAIDYDVPGETVWMSIPFNGTTITSNKLVWRAP
jgi:hypothetical protein